MRTSATLSVCGLGVGGVALAVMAVLSAACASGGNAPPVTGAEAEALFADLTGVWVLDESGSSPQLPDLPPELQRFEFTKGSARANRESAAMAGSLAQSAQYVPRVALAAGYSGPPCKRGGAGVHALARTRDRGADEWEVGPRRSRGKAPVTHGGFFGKRRRSGSGTVWIRAERFARCSRLLVPASG